LKRRVGLLFFRIT